MQDNITLIFCMIMIVIMFIVFPLYNLFERQDDMTYTTVLRLATNFVDQVRVKGYIDDSMVDELATKLGSTGNIYDIQIEGHRQVLLHDIDEKYSVDYVIDYSDDIFKFTSSGTSNIDYEGATLVNNAYHLEKGDKIYIQIRNANITLATSLLSFLKVTERTDKINIRYGGSVTQTTWK